MTATLQWLEVENPGSKDLEDLKLIEGQTIVCVSGNSPGATYGYAVFGSLTPGKGSHEAEIWLQFNPAHSVHKLPIRLSAIKRLRVVSVGEMVQALNAADDTLANIARLAQEGRSRIDVTQ
jgi:hypothetical protein